MKPFLKLFSPAKINLFFKVLYNRKDGYHEIASLYQAISLGDILSIRLFERDNFICNDLSLKFNESNLIYKAIELFKERTNLSFEVDIDLEKNIPMQAGLGGGSSNAATTLYAINRLTNYPLSITELMEIGAEIGSDVNFFFSSGTSYCTGRGEIFRDIAPKNISLYLALPKFGVSTPSVYKNIDLNSLNDNDPQKALISYEKEELMLFNDLEISAFSLQSKLLDTKGKLLDMGFDNVVMTGSGSAFMCFGDNYNLDENQELSFYKIESIQRNSDSWYPNFL